MKSVIPKLSPVLGAAFLLVAGLVLRGPPLDPDVMMEHVHIAGAFLVFAGWAACASCWGRWVSHVTGTDRAGIGWLAPSLVLGPAFLSLLAFALGAAGLIGYSLSPIHMLLLLAGPILLARAGGVLPSQPRERWRPVELLLGAAIAYAFLTPILKASLANGTTDPPMYHLLGPRLWSEGGTIDLWPRWPAVICASYWEHLFIWGNSLLGGPEGRGLIEGQFFGQWTHVFFGMGATVAASFSLQRLLGVSRAWALVGCLSIMVSRVQLWYLALAKNDFGIEAWVLLAAGLLLSEEARRSKLQMIAGVLIGMSLMGKMVSIFSVSTWGAAWLAWTWWRKPRADAAGATAAVMAGTLLGMLPIMARNAWFTGNPVFPVLNAWFPDSAWITSQGREFVDRYMGFPLHDWRGFVREVAPAIKDSPLTPVALLLLPLAALGWASSRQAVLVACAALSVVGYCALNLFNSFLRWLAPSLGVLQFSGAASLEALVNRWVPSPGARATLALLPAGWLFLHVEHPYRAWNTLAYGESPTLAWRLPRITNGGDSKAWLRLNAKPGETVASTGDTGFYYMYYLKPFAVAQHPVLDPHAASCASLECYVRVLRSYGVKYLYDVAHWDQRYYSPVAAKLDRVLDELPRSLVYAGTESFVADLSLLEEDLMGGCVPEHLAPDSFLVP